MLAMEWHGESAHILRLAHGSSGFRVVEALELAGVDLSKYLARRGRDPLRVAGQFPHSFQRLLVLPAVDAALPEMIASEARQQLNMPAATSHVVLGREEQEGEPVMRVAAAAVAYEDLEQLAGALRRAATTPRLVTTVPHAVQALLARLGVLGIEPVALLDTTPATSTIYVFRGEEVRVVRVLPEAGTLTRDVKQTFVFHGSKFRGEIIRTLWVTGLAAEGANLAALQKELDCEVAPLDVRSVVTADTQDLAGFTACLGAAAIDLGSFPHAYVAPSHEAERRTRRTVTGMAVGLLVTSLAAAIPGAVLSRQVQLLHVRRASAESSIQSTESWLRQQPRRMVAHEVREVQPPWEVFLRELALATPAGATLQSLVVRRGPAGWEGTAAGEIPGRGTLEALTLTDAMRQRLQRSRAMRDADVVPIVEDAAMRFEVRFRLSQRGSGT